MIFDGSSRPAEQQRAFVMMQIGKIGLARVFASGG